MEMNDKNLDSGCNAQWFPVCHGSALWSLNGKDSTCTHSTTSNSTEMEQKS